MEEDISALCGFTAFVNLDASMGSSVECFKRKLNAKYSKFLFASETVESKEYVGIKIG